MALSTYSNLQAAVADWLERADLTARIPDFITLAEAQITRRLERPTLEEDTPLTGVPGSRFVPLPAGWDTVRHVWIVREAGRESLRPTTASGLDASASPGAPQFWCVDGDRLAFERPCDQAYALQARLSNHLALSGTNPTNAILLSWPDIYLWGACLEGAAFLVDPDREAYFRGRFEAAIADVGYHLGRNRSQARLRSEPGMSAGGVQAFDMSRGL